MSLSSFPWSTVTGLFFGTFVSEDGAFLAALALVRQGALPTWLGCLAAGGGIYFGDLLLFGLGRAAHRWGLARRFVDRHLKESVAALASSPVIIGARFVPGTRLPVYLAAGLSAYPFAHFALATLAAVTLWTLLGVVLLKSVLLHVSSPVAWSVAALIFVLLALAPRLRKSRRARQIYWHMARWRHFEFWPMWAFYPPVIVTYLLLGLRYRSLRLPLYANPGIPNGGIVGESKFAILAQLRTDRPEVLAQLRLDLKTLNPGAALEAVDAFVAHFALSYPLVIKPDVGQRGSGVSLARSRAEVATYLGSARFVVVVQEYARFPEEVGVNYLRYPGEKTGRIVGITRKRFPEIHGDGRRTLADLILDDPRARYVAGVYFARHATKLDAVLPLGQTLRLVEAGNHCQGTIFEDGQELAAPGLSAALDELAQELSGFYVGRFDLRFASEEDLRAGRNFQIIEINGGAGEATHIYDSRMSLVAAYRILFAQLRALFEIGLRNIQQQGSWPTNLVEAWLLNRRTSRLHPPTT